MGDEKAQPKVITKKRKPKRRRPRGMGSLYYRAPWWWVKWTENGAPQYQKFLQKEVAERALAKIVSDFQATGVGLALPPPVSPALSSLWEDWIAIRKLKVRSYRDDESRWRTHLEPFFGSTPVRDIDKSFVRRFIEAKLAAGLNPATINRCVTLLSVFFEDLLEDGVAKINPKRALGRRTKRLMRSTHDSSQTPILEKAELENVFRQLEEPYNIAFALGALAGIRPGEAVALDWADIDLDCRAPDGKPTPRLLVHQAVRHGALGPPKDGESRHVPVLAPLLPVLRAWKLKSGGAGLVVPPKVTGRGRTSDRGTAYVKNETLNGALEAALTKLKIKRPGLTWYSATKHSFATRWVADGGSLEKLALILGHSMPFVTTTYQHLRLDHFDPLDYGRVALDLTTTKGKVLKLRGAASAAVSCGQATEQQATSVAKKSKSLK